MTKEKHFKTGGNGNVWSKDTEQSGTRHSNNKSNISRGTAKGIKPPEIPLVTPTPVEPTPIPNTVEPAKPPNMFQMIRSFSKDLGKYIKEGAPNVTEEQYADRLEICSMCPHFIEKTMRCGVCGCLMEHKAKWQTAVCPDDPARWDSVVPVIAPIKKEDENRQGE